MYEIRIFKEQFDNPIYYHGNGNEDVKIRCQCSTKDELISLLEMFLQTKEGETYSVWDLDKKEIITGGSFDPNVIDIIKEYQEPEYIRQYSVDILGDITEDEIKAAINNIPNVVVVGTNWKATWREEDYREGKLPISSD